MGNKFHFATTGDFPGWKISDCRGVVCANVVVGTNVFSDFAASVTDFFGGKSGTYGRKLEYAYEEAKKELEAKARKLGAKADSYDGKDLATMEGICEFYDSLPDTGRMEKVKAGVFSKKEEEKFICENGHENETYNEFCHKCGVNIKGLNRTEAALVDKFKRKTEALKAIFRGQEQQVRKGSGKAALSSRQQKGIPERMPYNIGRLRRP